CGEILRHCKNQCDRGSFGLREETVGYSIYSLCGSLGFTVTLPCLYICSSPFIAITFWLFSIVRNILLNNSVGPTERTSKTGSFRRMKLVKLSLSITIAFAVCFCPMCMSVVVDGKSTKTNLARSIIVLQAFCTFLESALKSHAVCFTEHKLSPAFTEMFQMSITLTITSGIPFLDFFRISIFSIEKTTI
ncbi:hypothetical protein QZH41_018832, partial [Actinostola sp. cb2023]